MLTIPLAATISFIIAAFAGSGVIVFYFIRKDKKPKNSGAIIVLSEGTEESWQKCMSLGHVPTTYQYGLHPMRVYQFCPFCHIKSRLDWKDTYARTMNRIWGTMPALIAAVFTILTVVAVLVAIGFC